MKLNKNKYGKILRRRVDNLISKRHNELLPLIQQERSKYLNNLLIRRINSQISLERTKVKFYIDKINNQNKDYHRDYSIFDKYNINITENKKKMLIHNITTLFHISNINNKNGNKSLPNLSVNRYNKINLKYFNNNKVEIGVGTNSINDNNSKLLSSSCNKKINKPKVLSDKNFYRNYFSQNKMNVYDNKNKLLYSTLFNNEKFSTNFFSQKKFLMGDDKIIKRNRPSFKIISNFKTQKIKKSY